MKESMLKPVRVDAAMGNLLLDYINPIQTGGGGGAFEALPNFKVEYLQNH